MKGLFIALICFFLTIQSFSQSTFEYLYQDINDQYAGDILEDDNGNIIVSFFDFDNRSGNLIKISNTGILLNSYSKSEPNSIYDLKELVKLGNDTFIAIGVYNHDSIFNLRFCKFDMGLNLLFEQNIPTSYPIISDRMNATLNYNGNIIIGATYEIAELETSVCMFELTENGELLNQKYYTPSSPGIKLFYDLFEIPNTSNYKIFTTNFYQKSIGKIYTIDSAFNILYSTPFNWYLSDNHSVKLLNEDSYLLGLVRYLSKNDVCCGLVKHSMDEVVLDSILICDEQIFNYTAWIKSVDLINSTNIYFGSTHDMDIINPFFSTSPSWFMLNKLDGNLEPIWQKYFGGDAYYNLWTLHATQDGGCVMAGSRYDYQTQNQERDVYVLKVNEDGLITWAHNIPEVTKEILIYPNPGDDKIYIKTLEDNLTIELFDSNGQKKIWEKITNQDITLNTSELISGVYIYRILNDSKIIIETGKWIKN